ncbi:hypothetical protein GCM10022243_35030 [Saccharothrix violaceirubra]|uniref:Peptidase inhibitor family I36 n=1 Tax=Saccharothrix violaceirubra TaxID=413306 RepID=A0A7W7T796_9PSEU|nr:hypothetical protein [Saccharothrix violaceirubra]MBB4966555.1 hypothetical protein [Saccharothrix violaceirubra]
MKFIRTATAAALAVAALFGSFATASAASATETAIGCTDGSTPSGFPDQKVVKSVTTPVFGRRIELWYSSNTCAWGYLGNANSGDPLWVDRAANIAQANAGIWTQLGITQLNGTAGITRAYNDNRRVMRACAEVWDGFAVKVFCTGWY